MIDRALPAVRDVAEMLRDHVSEQIVSTSRSPESARIAMRTARAGISSRTPLDRADDAARRTADEPTLARHETAASHDAVRGGAARASTLRRTVADSRPVDISRDAFALLVRSDGSTPVRDVLDAPLSAALADELFDLWQRRLIRIEAKPRTLA